MIYSIWYAYFFKCGRSELNAIWQVKLFVSDVIFLIFSGFLIMAASVAYSDFRKFYPTNIACNGYLISHLLTPTHNQSWTLLAVARISLELGIKMPTSSLQ